GRSIQPHSRKLLLHPSPCTDDHADGFLEPFLVLQGCTASDNCQRVKIVGILDLQHLRNNLAPRKPQPQTHPCQSICLGESPHHDQVGKLFEQLDNMLTSK